jgi:hypothetical protein
MIAASSGAERPMKRDSDSDTVIAERRPVTMCSWLAVGGAVLGASAAATAAAAAGSQQQHAATAARAAMSSRARRARKFCPAIITFMYLTYNAQGQLYSFLQILNSRSLGPH